MSKARQPREFELSEYTEERSASEKTSTYHGKIKGRRMLHFWKEEPILRE